MKPIVQSLILAPLLLAGCASDPTQGTGPEVWWKPGLTNSAELAQAMARCRVLANQGAPGLAGWNAGSLLASAAMDKGRRKEIVRDCLLADGYQLTRRSLVPPGHATAED